MAFQKGHTKIEGSGRVKSLIKKEDEDSKKFLKKVIRTPALQKKYMRELKIQKGKQFTDSWHTLLEFVVPKLNKVDTKQNTAPVININFVAADKPETIDISHAEVDSNNKETN